MKDEQYYIRETLKTLGRLREDKEKYYIEMLGRRFIVFLNVFSPKFLSTRSTTYWKGLYPTNVMIR